jgi:hypothetical protein
MRMREAIFALGIVATIPCAAWGGGETDAVPPGPSAPAGPDHVPAADLPPPPPTDLAAIALPVGFTVINGRIRCAKDGAEVVLVPAGEFVMGCSRPGPGPSSERRVFLPSFLVDRTEVTLASFRRFCAETGRVPPRQPKGTGEDDGLQPAVNVLSDDALAYAAWVGRRLLTEAEWEKAARGTDGRAYPWGNKDDLSRRSVGPSVTDATTDPDRPPPGVLQPVGSFPSGASPFGCLDMAGSAWEWCAASPGVFALKGGAWCSMPEALRSDGRGVSVHPLFCGFRCAADLAWEGAPGREVLLLSARGTKRYRCAAGADGRLAWSLLGCRADLRNACGETVGIHRRDESGPPSWHLGEDGVSGTKIHERPSPNAGAIPELQLLAVSPGGVFAGVTLIERLHTTGGTPPPLDDSSKAGVEVEVAYAADYVFRAAHR